MATQLRRWTPRDPRRDRRDRGARAGGGRRYRRADSRQRDGPRGSGLRGVRGAVPGRWAVAHRGPGRVAGGPRRFLDASPDRQPGSQLRPEASASRCRPGNPLPTLSAFDCSTGLWLSPADVEASLTVELEGFTEALAELRTRLGPAASAAEGIEAYLATTGLAGERASTSPARAPRQCRGGRGRCGRAPVAGVAVDAGGVRRRLLRGPARGRVGRLWSDAMAAGLDVRLDWPVARVDLSDARRVRHVGVRGDRGRLARCCRGPPGCAQAGPAELRAAASARAGRELCADSASGGTRRWR